MKNRFGKKFLFYDLSNITPRPKGKQAQLDWLNSRKPLSTRIKEYNKKTYVTSHHKMLHLM